MRAISEEPVEVWLRNDRPARFVWRDRMYTVLFVVDRSLAGPATGGRECWLVEATPERAVPPARYQLCHDPASDRWSLLRF